MRAEHKEILDRVNRIAGDLGEIYFLGNDLAPNCFDILFNSSGNVDLLVERLKADKLKPIIAGTFTDEPGVRFFIYGNASPMYWGKDN